MTRVTLILQEEPTKRRHEHQGDEESTGAKVKCPPFLFIDDMV